MRCARVVVVSVVSGSRANLTDSIEASAQARSVTPPGGRFCTRSSKGSLAVNTAEKQRARSISHLRRQAIDRADEPRCLFSLPFCLLSKAITLRELLLSVGPPFGVA